MGLKFSDISLLNKDLINCLNSLGYYECSPIQERAIPLLCTTKSNNILLAQTGTGKTLSFLVPIFNDLDLSILNAIILVPTSSLGEQIFDVCQQIKKSYNKNISITLLKNDYDLNAYKQTGNILIITPTVFNKLDKFYNLKQVKRIIIDEGDMIAFDGFCNELVELVMRSKCQVSLFSASLHEHEITQLKKIINANKVIDVRNNSINASNTKHYLVNTKHYSNIEAIIKILEYSNYCKCIIFVSNKKDIESLSKELYSHELNHVLLHGDLSKREIKNSLDTFNNENSNVNIMLSSDYGSRGLDIKNVDVVISVDLPYELNYYFHRAGRTGRFNSFGSSFVLYNDENNKKIDALKKKNVKFINLAISKDGIKVIKEFTKTNTTRRVNDELNKEIHKIVFKNKSKKVKPNYKKKVKVQIERAKQRYRRKHKEKIYVTNIRKKNSQNEE